MLTAGTRLGPYEVVGSLGAGGMGEVYRARDRKLNRDVAIKVLPDLFAADPERMARFTREAQTLAALNHSGIAHVHGLEETASGHALVMELVEGEDLSAHVARGAMPVAEVLTIARQIAEALEAAHDQGIVHRDLKPANIKVKADGTVKVLDFGLAKAMDPAGASGVDVANSPTLTMRGTQMGIIVGTAAYMAPEQARGKAVDRRADIWAFGLVVYEMLTGRRAFTGDEVTDILAAVLRQEIDWSPLPSTTPPRLRALLERCLDRDPKSRLRDIGEARIEIARMMTGAADIAPAAVPRPPATARPLAWLPWSIVAALSAAMAGLLAVWSPWTRNPEPKPIRFVMPPRPGSAISSSFTDRNLAISPDGSHIAYAGQDGNLIVRAIDRIDATPIQGLSGVRTPFFSHDGRWVGFFDTVGLKKVSVDGGPAIPICAVDGTVRGVTWGPDDTIVFATADLATGLLAVPAGGGEPKPITHANNAEGEADHLWPTFLPGGDAVLFTILPTSAQIEAMQVAVLDRRTGRSVTLVRGGSDASYVASADGTSGYLVYAAAGTLRAVRFDPRTRTTAGDPVPVVEGVETNAQGAAQYGLSRSGSLVYQPGGLNAVNTSRSLVWVDRQGHEEPVAGALPRAYFAVRVSPDGSRLALDIRDFENDIWVWTIAGRTLTRLTFQPGVDALPIWTRDGRRIVFYGTATNLFWQSADGTGAIERLTTSATSQAPLSFSPDGKILLLRERTTSMGDDIAMMSMDTRQVKPFIQTPFNENNAQISPDGHFVAYDSNEDKASQVYVRPFPDINSGRWQVSTAGGGKPAWAPNGRELFYATAGAVMSVPVQTTPTFSYGPAVKLFDAAPIPTLISGRHYDVMPDGQRFILIKDPPPDPNTPRRPDLTVVVHWTTELGAKLPIR